MAKTVKLLISLAIIGLTCAQEEVTIDLPVGSLKGLKVNTILNNKPYYSFKGIPYAKPPIGPQKFDPPTEIDSWTGVLDATQHKSNCIYFCMLRKHVVGDEDCLYLNVYTPDINKDSKKPVIVFVHPGGFNAGSGDDDFFGPDFLIEQDVVVVTFNSRLGAHGYLSTEDENAPGNNGLKDQNMVLRWVQDNIENFGGFKDKVTLAGCSSGSASVQFHLISPMSRGLFKNAIMHSGSVLNPWAMQYTPKENAFKLGEALGIKTTDTKELVNKLKEHSVMELFAASGEVTKDVNHLNGHLDAFVPAVEPDVGQEIFLPNDPWTMIKENEIDDVPIMIGVLQNETAYLAPIFLPSAVVMDDPFDMFVPEDLNATDAKKKEMSDMLKNLYFDGKAVTDDTLQQFTMMSTDIFFGAGIYMSSKILAAREKSPIYNYLFSYYSPFGLYKSLFNSEEGVAHADDLTFIFYSNGLNNKPEPGSSNEKMVKTMTKLWANFAREGNPTPSLDDDITITWTPMGSEENYMELNLPLKMNKVPNKDRMSLWAQIYNDVLGDYAKDFRN